MALQRFLCALISLKFDIDLDAAVGGLISLFIIYSGIQLIIETSSPLLGEAPPDDLVKKIYEIALSHTGVLGLHDLVVHSYGAGRIFASVHIEVDAEGDILESHDLIDNVEKEISGELGIHFVVHMDPIIVHDPLIEKLSACAAADPAAASLHRGWPACGRAGPARSVAP